MYSIKEIKRALKVLKKNGNKITKTAKELGISPRTLTEWRNKEKNDVPLLIRPYIHIRNTKYTKDQKRAALNYYFSHGECASLTCRMLGYPKVSTMKHWLYNDKRYIKKNKIVKQNKQKIISKSKQKKKYAGYKRNDIDSEIIREIAKALKTEINKDYSNIDNKSKFIVCNKLKGKYSLKELLVKLNLNKQTYYYQSKIQNKDKYIKEKDIIRKIFYDNYCCYGYRRIKFVLENDYHIKLSEKVVSRLMKEMNLIVYQHKSKKYSSYKGEITPQVPNIINRDFKAEKPYTKLLTDITEFSLKDGKVYLSPMIDCFSGSPINYEIGYSPNTALTNKMLENTIKIIGNNKPIIHSDRGFHYRVDSWISLMNSNDFIRSMSKKGCSPDNSMCEGFFGTLKNEFFYGKDWTNCTRDEFVIELNKYLDWFINKRIKNSLNYKTPKEYNDSYKKSK